MDDEENLANQEIPGEEEESSLQGLFDEDDEGIPDSDEKPEKKSNKDAPTAKKKDAPSVSRPSKEPVKEEADTFEEDEEEPAKKDHPKPEKEDPDAELEKMTKRHKEAEKWGNQARKQLAAHKKAVEKLKEDGVLTEDEATILLDHTKFDGPETEESFLMRFAKVWDEEVENIRTYSPDSDKLDQYQHALQHMFLTSSPKEIQSVMEELEELRENGDKKGFMKYALQVAKEYNDDVFEELYNAKSLKNLVSSYKETVSNLKEEIDKRDKKIDKLKKKHEDYTDPVEHIRQGSSPKSGVSRNDARDLNSLF